MMYPAETRYYFQNPNTGRACFLYYCFAKGQARLLVIADDREQNMLSTPMEVEDRALARALTASYYPNQYELERELRQRQIDWTADNR